MTPAKAAATGDHALRNWLMGILGTIVTAAILGTASLLFTMNGEISALQATQVQLITSINRMLDAFDEL